MKRIVSVAVTVLTLAACAAPDGAQDSELTAGQLAALADTFQMEGEKFSQGLADLDGPAIAGLFAEELIYFDNGNIYPSRARIDEIATGFFDRLERLEGHWEPSNVLVLGPDAGVFWGVFHADDANWNDSEANPPEQRGQALWEDGYSWTLVYQRSAHGGFEVTHAHQSSLPPGRLDQYK